MESCSYFAGVFDVLDLWVIVPFLLGYFSWKLLFVDVAVPGTDKTSPTKIVDEPTSPRSGSDVEDDEQEDKPKPGDISSELERIREEIRKERAQVGRVSEKRSAIGGHPCC